MDLATFQRQLRGLIKSNYNVSENDDPYIRAVASSPNLALVQEIIVSWRLFSLEQCCHLTVALLKRNNLFEDSVRAFIASQYISPFTEVLGIAFLQRMGEHDDCLVASVAQFELALIQAKNGNAAHRVVAWKHDPCSILMNLLNGLPLNEESVRGSYQTIVSCDIPDFFMVTTS